MTSFHLQTQMLSCNGNYISHAFELTTNNAILTYHIITLDELLQWEQHY